MINLFKQDEGFNYSTFTGVIQDEIEQIPAEIEDKLIQVTEQEFQDLIDHKLMWQNGVLVENPDYEEYVKEQERQNKIGELHYLLAQVHIWFSSTDWMFNKIYLGEWAEDDERWLNYKRERAIKRQEQDEILEQLRALGENV